MPAPPAASTGSNRQSAMYDPFATDFSSPTSSPTAPAATVAKTVTGPAPPLAGTPPKRARPSRWGRPHGLEHGSGSGSGLPGSAAAAADPAGLADVSGGAAQAAQARSQAGATLAPDAEPRLGAAAAQAPGRLGGHTPLSGAQGPPAPSAAPAVQYKGPNGETYPPPPLGGVPEEAMGALRAAMEAMSDPESPPPPPPTSADGAATERPPYGLAYDLGPELRGAWGLPHPDDLGASPQQGSRAPQGTDPSRIPNTNPGSGAAAAAPAPVPPPPPAEQSGAQWSRPQGAWAGAAAATVAPAAAAVHPPWTAPPGYGGYPAAHGPPAHQQPWGRGAGFLAGHAQLGAAQGYAWPGYSHQGVFAGAYGGGVAPAPAWATGGHAHAPPPPLPPPLPPPRTLPRPLKRKEPLAPELPPPPPVSVPVQNGWAQQRMHARAGADGGAGQQQLQAHRVHTEPPGQRAQATEPQAVHQGAPPGLEHNAGAAAVPLALGMDLPPPPPPPPLPPQVAAAAQAGDVQGVSPAASVSRASDSSAARFGSSASDAPAAGGQSDVDCVEPERDAEHVAGSAAAGGTGGAGGHSVGDRGPGVAAGAAWDSMEWERSAGSDILAAAAGARGEAGGPAISGRRGGAVADSIPIDGKAMELEGGEPMEMERDAGPGEDQAAAGAPVGAEGTTPDGPGGGAGDPPPPPLLLLPAQPSTPNGAAACPREVGAQPPGGAAGVPGKQARPGLGSPGAPASPVVPEAAHSQAASDLSPETGAGEEDGCSPQAAGARPAQDLDPSPGVADPAAAELLQDAAVRDGDRASVRAADAVTLESLSPEPTGKTGAASPGATGRAQPEAAHALVIGPADAEPGEPAKRLCAPQALAAEPGGGIPGKAGAANGLAALQAADAVNIWPPGGPNCSPGAPFPAPAAGGQPAGAAGAGGGRAGLYPNPHSSDLDDSARLEVDDLWANLDLPPLSPGPSPGPTPKAGRRAGAHPFGLSLGGYQGFF